MISTRAITLCLTIASFLCIGGCDGSTEMDKKMSDAAVLLKLHENGEEFSKRYPGLIQVNKQPAGLTFYDAEWNSSEKGKVTIDTGSGALRADDVLYLTAVQDDLNKAEGISTASLSSGITGPKGITHDAAREYIFAALSRLRNDGWKPFIPFDDPRIRGRNMLNYQLANSSVITLDPDYKPTPEEWIRLPDRSGWELRTESAFIRITFHRSPNPKDPSGPGLYLVNFDLKSTVNHFKGFVDPSHRDEWRKLLPGELKDLASRRNSAEAKLREQGIEIDTEYKDPSIPQ